MVLATLIRIEFSYPGVGIFAGDSLQYLTLASAHAVIMVFFMILPLLFGAFGNYLLPTQLGVHDVAFPRLNSAAFWFFPSSLIMLCQLVCTDRRYQRMNCFNIREVQALLKRRFFNDLINSHDYHLMFDNTVLGLRYKTGNLHTTNHSNFIFYNYGLNLNHQVRSTSYVFNEQKISTSNAENISSFFKYLSNTTLNSFLLKFESIVSNFNLFNIFNLYLLPNDNRVSTFSESMKGNTVHLVRDFISSIYFSVLNAGEGFYSTVSALFNDFFSTLNVTTTFLVRSIINIFSTIYIVTFYLYSFIYNTLKPFPIFTNFNFIYYSSESYLNSLNLNLSTKVTDFYHASYSLLEDFLPKTILSSFSLENSLYSFFVNNNLLKGVDNTSFIFFMNSLSTYAFNLDNNKDKNVGNSSSAFIILSDQVFKTSVDYLPSQKISSIIEYFIDFVFLLNFTTITLYLSKIINSISSYINLFTTNSLNTKLNFKSDYYNNLDQNLSNKLLLEESSESSRFLKFDNPVFKYDYKSGNYFPPLYNDIFSHLFTTIADITSSTAKASWYFSPKFNELLLNSLKTYTSNPFNLVAGNNSTLTNVSNLKQFSGVDGIFGFFSIIQNDTATTNARWVSLNVLNQKFYKMFSSSSTQQRIYSNWRQLKFTREAWRCKLLSARHQKTLYKRYVNEDGVFWSIERNARDLLPGWAMITPFSSRTRFTAIGRIDIGLMGVLLAITASIISGANFLVTCRYLATLNNRKMRDARSFFSECIMVASWMMISANPMLVIGIIMLISDRHWQTSFFDYSGGGDSVLFQHMFWFFGHPEVYIIVIPSFGFINMSFSYYLRKRISARASLIYSLYTIAFLGFFVWGHHMYMVGLSHTTRMLFSTLTVMISVPAATKLMHWCVTISNSVIVMELPFLCTLVFVFLFVSGGISGMAVAHTGMDILFHDTFYVVGHFHVLLAGAAMFSSFGAIYFYFPSLFGVKYSRLFAYIHFVYYLIGHFMTFIPMFWLGYAGMPRRVLDYPAALGGWHSLATGGHILAVGGMTAFFIMIFDSLRQARAATRNTFGISRFNTRLNFYLYEVSRLTYIQRKGLFLYRYVKPNSVKLNNMNYTNFEYLETTSFSYIFSKN